MEDFDYKITDIYGHYTLGHKGNIVYVKGIGAWDEKGPQNLFQDFPKVIEAMDAEQWAFIVDLREWDLATPEALDMWPSFQERLVEGGLKCMAMVYEESFLKTHLTQKYVSDELIPIDMFTCEQDALVWCQTILTTLKED